MKNRSPIHMEVRPQRQTKNIPPIRRPNWIKRPSRRLTCCSYLSSAERSILHLHGVTSASTQLETDWRGLNAEPLGITDSLLGRGSASVMGHHGLGFSPSLPSCLQSVFHLTRSCQHLSPTRYLRVDLTIRKHGPNQAKGLDQLRPR